MEVILLEKVRNLGNLGQKVNVKAGYGRNYLIPGGKAVMATKANIEKFEARRAELEQKASDELVTAQARAAKLAELAEVSISVRAGDEGKLFGSVNAHDIVEAVAAAGIELEKREVLLPDGPIRMAGTHEVELALHTDVVQTIKVNVIPE
jgi:large subunit ribosomal protein L9